MTPTGKSVEEMARELAYSGIYCPESTKGITCPEPIQAEHPWKGCTECWIHNATPAEITAKYREMKGEGE
jgi:hypothetical protein